MKQELINKLSDYIGKKILQAHPGDIITTEVAVSEYLGVSRPTARKYIDDYAKTGQITRVPGKGIAYTLKTAKNENTAPKNYMIMVAPFSFTDGFFSEIVKGIVDVLNERGDQYRIFMSVDYSGRLEFLKTVDISEFDGAFITAYEDSASYEIVDILEKNGISITLVDNQLDYHTLNCAKNDDLNGGYRLGDYLGAKGCVPLFLLPSQRNGSTSTEYNDCQMDSSIRDRIRGVQWGLKKHGLQMPDENFLSIKYIEDVVEKARTHETIIFYDSTAAWDTMQSIYKYDRNLYDRIKVVVFGNALTEQGLNVVANIRFDGYAIGVSAAEIAMGCDDSRKTVVCIPTRLVTNGE